MPVDFPENMTVVGRCTSLKDVGETKAEYNKSLAVSKNKIMSKRSIANSCGMGD